MSMELQKRCPKVMPQAPGGNSRGCLFVATSLATWTTANPEQFTRDFQINDTVYRRLDPKYYIWLRSRIVAAKRAASIGHLDAAAFEDLRVRFNAMHPWAVEHFSEAQLLAAVRTFVRATTSRRCLRRSVHEVGGGNPLEAQPRNRTHRPREATGRSDSRPGAGAGMDHGELVLLRGYERRPIGPRYGLVCYVGAKDRIGELTRQSIELIGLPPVDTKSRF